MNSFRLFATLAFAAGFISLPAHVFAAESAPKTVLQMRVDAPFVFDVIHEDDLEDALFFRVKDALTARHRDLEIKQVETDEFDAGAPLVTITLVNWRTTRMGDIECRFTAEYSSADGTRSLGVFDGTTSAITRSRAFIGADFERAAEEAGRRLGETLSKQGLI